MSRLPPISSLMSPPEAKPHDHFSPTISSANPTFVTHQTSFTPDNTLPPISDCQSPKSISMRILPSPPVSPWAHNRKKADHPLNEVAEEKQEAIVTRDPVLYPNSESHVEVASDQPLFPVEPSLASVEEIVSQHMASHMSRFDKKFNRPTREEYLLALSCVPNIGQSYNRNPGAYMKRVREETEEQYWQAKRICAKPGSKASSHINIAPAPIPKQPKKAIRAAPAAKPIIRAKRTPKHSPVIKLLAYPVDGNSSTPELKLPGTKRPEDVDYGALPDYAPPTSTLPKGNPKCLKADWGSNNPLNLANDPDRHMLHEAEINLASTLRLTCATYLCSKRRIFEGRLNTLRIGKEFRKTDAQQACKIDVNKASKLWSAYDKVGWFNKGHFEQNL